MAGNSSQKLDWCNVRLGKDMNWWLKETSAPVHWDHEGISIIDPKQIAYIIEHADVLTEYGFRLSILDNAFFKFGIEKELGDKKVRLKRIDDSLLAAHEPLFALPDILDEEKGPYADLITQLIKARVKMLNDLIDFEHNLTVDELEEEIRESQNAYYLEGRSVHAFEELMGIIDYVPFGYELDSEEGAKGGGDDYEDSLGDVEEENLDEDETMRWGDEDAHAHDH